MVATAAVVSAVAGVATAANSISQSRRANSIAQRAAEEGAETADPAHWARPFFQDFLLENFQSMAQVNPQSIENDPNYQFQMEQGSEAIRRSGISNIGYRNGTTLEDLTKFGQGLAASFVDRKFNQNMSLMDRIMAAGGFTTGSPAAAGQILANGGIAGQNQYNQGLAQLGAGINQLGRINWGQMFNGGGSHTDTIAGNIPSGPYPY